MLEFLNTGATNYFLEELLADEDRLLFFADHPARPHTRSRFPVEASLRIINACAAARAETDPIQ